MKKTFFFYDLETSGFSPKSDRIMQFAGQRTDLDLNKIGEPVNILVRLNDDVLPSPNALMVTKISPQQTLDEGYTEAEFAKIAAEDIFTPGTTAVGYNSVRFDDEHMRHLFWRNFYDPYEWQWKDDRSRWDLLDVVRMVRALRPENINWPFIENGSGEQIAANKLELLTKINGIEHEHAHDAMSDVDGLIDVAKLLKQKQPQIFDYLLRIRDKNEVKKLVNLDNPAPFVYTSGRLSAEFNKTTIAYPVAPAPNRNVVVWDLRYDPSEFLEWSTEDILKNLTTSWDDRQKDDFKPLPAKILQYNKCPAVAPIGVLNEDNYKDLKLDPSQIKKNIIFLKKNPHFLENIRTAFEDKNKAMRVVFEDNPSRAQSSPKLSKPESQLYNGLLPDNDRVKIEGARNAKARELADFHPGFADDRLLELLLHYKARSFPKSLSAEEKTKWEEYRILNLNSMLPKFMAELKQIAERDDLTSDEEFIIEELKLWLENVLPDNE